MCMCVRVCVGLKTIRLSLVVVVVVVEEVVEVVKVEVVVVY